ncbi:hypothetical protein MOBT1_002779 [Malassezia obtusa]|uniref:SnoaL-like domain-containing protein n=1 Tax=Malassezia obtusa TaxID=76774 RepID=A0AAF0E2J9_9BASI|nr:hypothetical protein MOBT1_002779 [Malassezia obtusa]
MSQNLETNKAVVRDLIERVMNGRDFRDHTTCLTDDFESHRAERTITGGANWIKTFGHIVENFIPEFRCDIQRMVAEGNQVWTLSYISGSPEGAEGKRRLSVDIFELRDGKIARHWDVQQNVDPTSNNIGPA